MFLKNLVRSIFAGMSIAIAGSAYLSVDNSTVGAMLFSVGLITIYLFEWNLYTGKCCYLAEDFKGNFGVVTIAFIGNLLGTFITGYALRFSGLSIYEEAELSVASKVANSHIESFILAIFCGILMSIAVVGYKKQKDDFGRAIIIILPITVFIVAKFEHVIANIFYISLADEWSITTIVFTAVCAIGNAIGCNIILMGNKFLKLKQMK